jgi:hypothetical protein
VDLATADSNTIHSQISQCEQAFTKAIGKTPTLIRPP